MTTLDKDISTSRKFPKLFHYTTIEAFESIYRSQSLWATHFKDFNDRSELRRFYLLAERFAAEEISEIFGEQMRRDAAFAQKVSENGGFQAVIEHEAKVHVHKLHQSIFGEGGLPGPFVCSFCTHPADSYEAEHGLLSQWRGYGLGGVAVIFETLGIEALMEEERDLYAHTINHIGNVKYDSDLPKIAAGFQPFFQEFIRGFYSQKSEEEHMADYELILQPFLLGTTLVKHHAFREENEVRIVVSPRPSEPGSSFFHADYSTKRQKQTRTRTGRRRADIQYIELFGGSASKPLPTSG